MTVFHTIVSYFEHISGFGKTKIIISTYLVFGAGLSFMHEFLLLHNLIFLLHNYHIKGGLTNLTGRYVLIYTGDMLKDGLKILITDDDDDDHQIFRDAVQSLQGAHVTYHAYGCKDLFDVLSRQIIDIIFMDIRMPLIDGQKCLKEIKADPDLANIPVVMYSTSRHDHDIDQAYEAGAVRYFIKPSDFTRIIATLEELLENDWPKSKDRPDRSGFLIDDME